jgi:tetratricopeptide (TPR) repeat protein
MRRSDAENLEVLVELEPDQALVVLDELIGEQPEDADLWAWLAEARAACGDLHGALDATAHYLTLDAAWIEAYAQRAEWFAELGRWGQAAQELTVGREIDGEDPRLRWSEGVVLELQGKLDEADRAFNDAHAGDEELAPPVRLPRDALRGALAQIAATQGAGLRPTLAEVPATADARWAGMAGLQSRLFDRAGSELVVYARNIERELDEDADLSAWTELAIDALAAGA